MKNRKARAITVLVAAVTCALLLLPQAALAESTGSISMQIQDAQTPLENVHVRAWRVAEATGDFDLVSPFSESGVDLTSDDGQTWPATGTDAKWSTLAQSLAQFALTNDVMPDAEGDSDAQGNVVLSGLQDGVYLVLPETFEQTDGTSWTFSASLVSLPQWVDGNLTRLLEITPKGQVKQVPEHLKVVKMWDDQDSSARPVSVTVKIARNGELYDTVELSQENNWTYEWETEQGYEWSVSEELAADSAYTMSIEQRSDGTFVVTNHSTTPPAPQTPKGGSPKTGDSSVPGMVLGVCAAVAVVVLIVAVVVRKKKK
ncbi:MAG: Cna B-type domain-containing protein [Atopobiaceae bacterium]|jgi:LPXTG-motif cell wall-anchored protein